MFNFERTKAAAEMPLVLFFGSIPTPYVGIRSVGVTFENYFTLNIGRYYDRLFTAVIRRPMN
jgi:hypothetical protein